MLTGGLALEDVSSRRSILAAFDTTTVKTLLLNMLSALGLVPKRRYANLLRQADELSKEVRVWKKRAAAADAKVANAERQLKQQLHHLKEARAAAEQKVVAAKRHQDEWKAMQLRLTDAERALAIARDQLMAVEVKLDILEGAANVLDARTRASVEQRARQVI